MDKKPDSSHQVDQDENPNSWEYVRKDRELLIAGFEHQRLEQAWQMLNLAYEYERELFPRDADESACEMPVYAFMRYVREGCYPPPEILQSVAQCFDIYFALGGNIELEEAFFGRPKRGVGTMAVRGYAEMPYAEFDRFVRSPARIGEAIGASFEKFASNPGNDHLFVKYASKDADAFLKGYRRWRGKRKGAI